MDIQNALVAHDPFNNQAPDELAIPPAMKVALQVLIGAALPTGLGYAGKALAGLGAKVKGLYDQLSSQTVNSWLSTAGKIAYYAGWEIAEQFVPVGAPTDQVDAQANMTKNLNRLKAHGQEFADCCQLAAEQIGQLYLDNSASLKEKAAAYAFMGYNGAWALTFWQDLIVQNIQANVLNVLANLADQGFDKEHPFADTHPNPIGRIFSVFGNCCSSFDAELEEIENKPLEEREALYDALFQQMSTALLSKIFPHGSEDITLFHHTLRPRPIIDAFLWPKIQQALPPLLKQLYLETRPVEQEHPDWKEDLIERTAINRADWAIKAPSALLQQFIKDDKGKLLKQYEPSLEKELQAKGVQNSKGISKHLIEFARQFLLSEDPAVCRIGSFFERYFMERLLFNFSETDPAGNEAPLIFYHLERLISGDFFDKVIEHLSGKKLPPEDYKDLLGSLLALGGLDKKETFPLPELIKKEVWPQLEQALTTQLPQLIRKQLFRWSPLAAIEKNKEIVEEWIDDETISHAISAKSKEAVDKGFAFIAKLPIGEMLNKALTAHPMTPAQIQSLNEQWEALFGIEENNDALSTLKVFAEVATQSLAYQLLKDLYSRYSESQGLEGMQQLFGEEDEEGDALSFEVWLFEEMAQALQLFNLSNLSDNQVHALRQTIFLKNKIKASEDEAEIKILQTRLDKLWPKVEPQFKQMKQHFFSLLGYTSQDKLPVPKQFQALLWNQSNLLPKMLLEETSDLILPLLDKHRNQKKIDHLPQGKLIIEGCKTLAQDISKNLPSLIDSDQLIDKLPLPMTEDAQSYLSQTVQDLIDQNHAVYRPFWRWIESYIEGLSLSIAAGLCGKSQHQLNQLKAKTTETLTQLSGKTPEEADVLIQTFVEDLLIWLGINGTNVIFGVPPAVAEKLVGKVKVELGKRLLGAYKLHHAVLHIQAGEAPSKEHQAVLAATRYLLDQGTGALASQADGQVQVVQKIREALSKTLDAQKAEGFELAGVVQKALNQPATTTFLSKLFLFLDSPDFAPKKEAAAVWISPVLGQLVKNNVTPLLEKEQKGKAQFDQALFTSLLPGLTLHFKHLNEASAKEGGLASLLEEEQPQGTVKQKQKKFYDGQTDQILGLVFPNGKESIKTVIGEIAPELIDPIWNGLKPSISEKLSSLQNEIFNEESLTTLFHGLFKAVLKNLQAPIEIVANEVDEEVELTEVEKEQQQKMDEDIGKLVVEAARFLNLPIDSLYAMPNLVKRMIGLNQIEQNAFASIGKSLRKTFQGDVLSKALDDAFAEIAQMKYQKVSQEDKPSDETKLEELATFKSAIAKEVVAYPFRYFAACLHHATDLFSNPLLKTIHEGISTLTAFVMSRVIGSVLRLFKIEQFAADLIEEKIDEVMDKTFTVFSKPDLYEDLIYREVEALENVLANPPLEKEPEAEIVG